MILLLRHAKSAWGQPGLDDHDRPLNRRGERAAEAMADHIVRNVPRPDLILCSTAVRTRQTLAPLIHRLTVPAPPIALETGPLPRLRGRRCWSACAAIPEEVGTVLLIGHNEGIGELAESLAGSGRATDLGALRDEISDRHPGDLAGAGRSLERPRPAARPNSCPSSARAICCRSKSFSCSSGPRASRSLMIMSERDARGPEDHDVS